MRKPAILLFPFILFSIGIMACKTKANVFTEITTMENNGTVDTMSNYPASGPIKIRVGTSTFTATLLDNPTVTAFKARLPMTVSMSELNGNEKYYNSPKDLPTKAANPGTIQTGDLMLYSSNTLVIFYKSFPTSYSYTKIGRIDNPMGLAAALGSGNITVTFELE